MTRRWLFLLLLGFGLIAGTASARLGESETELVKRFGKVTLRSKHSVFAQGKSIELGPVLYFREGDWVIACHLIDGVCMKIDYGKPGDWTEEHIQLVLTANGQGTTWAENSKTGIKTLQRTWQRTDGSTAKWSKASGMTLVWKAYETAVEKVKERARVENTRKPKI